MPDLIGKTFGKYRIVQLLGAGGMASVYKAYQGNLDRHVALKLMHPTLLADNPEALDRFVREAKNIAALRHPNIVQIHDFDIEDDTPYIVMELVEGESLKTHLERLHDLGEWVSTAEAIRIIQEVGQALSYAHQHEIIHRDVKPANVMVDGPDLNARIILADFGIAKLLTGPSQTATGLAIGTPAYMAPEQGQGSPGDHRADIYSLGVMLYELLTGRLPYHADTPLGLIIKHITEPLPAPRSIKPDLPEPLERVILRSLTKSVDERFQSVAETLAFLHVAATESAIQVAPLLYELPTQKRQPPTEDVTAEAEVLPLPAGHPGSLPAVIERDITHPPQPALPPRFSDLVGREAQLKQMAEVLTDKHVLVITGMAGIGKTTLAVALAEQVGHPAKTFWHSFHAGEGMNALIWKLAGFLFWRNKPALWDILQRTQQTGGQPPPPEVLFDYLFQLLEEQGYLLCLDDLQFVSDDPLLNLFVERLQELIRAGDISVIITSRHVPAFEGADTSQTLTGLSVSHVRQLLDKREVVLTTDTLETLHKRTEGNPQLLTLALDALGHSRDPIRLIRRLAESQHIERFLINEVDVGLTDNERRVMSALAVLGRTSTRDAISATLDGQSVRRELNELTGRYLVNVTDGEIGKEYGQHALVSELYYELLDKREQQAMHLRAGEYYEGEDILRAAYHFQRAGQDERAAQFVVGKVWNIINRGEAHILNDVLSQLKQRAMTPTHWAAVLIARGQVAEFLGEMETGEQSYQAAHTFLTTLPDSPQVRELRIQTCRGMGELLQIERPNEALEWLGRGLEQLSDDGRQEEAALRIRTGRILAFLGKNAEAVAELQSGLTLLPDQPSRLHVTALGNLANIYCTQGDVERGWAHYQKVEVIARQLDDQWLLVENWLNLGIEFDIAARFEDAIKQYRQALEQAEHLGSVRQKMRALSALGNTLLKLGHLSEAKENLNLGLVIARNKHWETEQVYILISLAGLHVQNEEMSEAEPLLAQAEELARKHEVRDPLSELYRYWALARLRQNQLEAALVFAERAVSMGRELQAENEEGVGLRVLGQVQLASAQTDLALASFERSLDLLADRDPYQAAWTKLEWALALRSSGDFERVDQLLSEAYELFQRLGTPGPKGLENL